MDIEIEKYIHSFQNLEYFRFYYIPQNLSMLRFLQERHLDDGSAMAEFK